jgi:hypothetical protein
MELTTLALPMRLTLASILIVTTEQTQPPRQLAALVVLPLTPDLLPEVSATLPALDTLLEV